MASVFELLFFYCSSTSDAGREKKEGHRMKLLCVLVMTCGRMKAKVGMTCLLFLVFFSPSVWEMMERVAGLGCSFLACGRQLISQEKKK